MPQSQQYIDMINATDDPTQRMIIGQGILHGMGFHVLRPANGIIQITHALSKMMKGHHRLIEYVKDISWGRAISCPSPTCQDLFYHDHLTGTWHCSNTACHYFHWPVTHLDLVTFLQARLLLERRLLRKEPCEEEIEEYEEQSEEPKRKPEEYEESEVPKRRVA